MKIAAIMTMVLMVPFPVNAQWTEPVRISEPGGCLYQQILAQGDTLHVAYQNVSAGGYIGYVRSADAGDTWSEFQILNDTVNTLEAFIPRILSNGTQIMIIWLSIDSHGVNRFNIDYSISTDNGVSWGDPQSILSSNWSFILFFTADGSGSNAIVILNTQLNEDEEIYYCITTSDFGQTWSQPLDFFRPAQSDMPDLAAYDGLFHFAWGGRFDWDSSWEAYYASSTDGGLSWSENILMSEADQCGSHRTSICANQGGVVRFAWTDFKYSPYWFLGDIFIRQSFDSGESWTPEQQLTFHHYVDRSDIVSKGDSIHIAWVDQRPANGDMSIYYIRSTDGGLTWSDERRLDNDPLESRVPALALSNGNVYAVWADYRNDPGPGVYFARYAEDTDVFNGQDLVLHSDSLYARPNPFNSNTMIFYSCSGAASDITILNSLGQVVRSYDIHNRKQGRIVWRGKDQDGKPVAAGVYFVRVGPFHAAKTLKLIYVR